MRHRKTWDEADARACIAKVTKSGQPREGWARSAEIDRRSLRARTVNLARDDRGFDMRNSFDSRSFRERSGYFGRIEGRMAEPRHMERS
jgi:hypothetical protein